MKSLFAVHDTCSGRMWIVLATSCEDAEKRLNSIEGIELDDTVETRPCVDGIVELTSEVKLDRYEGTSSRT